MTTQLTQTIPPSAALRIGYRVGTTTNGEVEIAGNPRTISCGDVIRVRVPADRRPTWTCGITEWDECVSNLRTIARIPEKDYANTTPAQLDLILAAHTEARGQADGWHLAALLDNVFARLRRGEEPVTVLRATAEFAAEGRCGDDAALALNQLATQIEFNAGVVA